MQNLFRDTLIYGLATVLSRGLALLVLPIYTRLLSPADYGALDMITVVGALATLVVAFEITQALARLYGEAGTSEARRAMASTALWFSTGAYLAAFLAAYVATPFLAARLLGPGMETPFRIGSAFIAVNGIFYLLQNQLRVELRSKSYALLSLFYACATVGLGVLLGYVLNLGLNGILAAQLAAALLSVIGGLLMLRESYNISFNLPLLKDMLHFSIPLVPSGMATFLTLYANRLLLNGLMTLEAVGLFGVATRIAGIVSLLVLGLQSALTPLIYAHYREAGTPLKLGRLFERFVAVALAFCLGLGLFGGELLAIFADSRYATAAPYIAALAPATLFSQMYIFFPGIGIARKTHLQFFIFGITAVASLSANWLLVQYAGLWGAVVATLLSAGLFLVIWIMVSQKLYPLPVRWKKVSLIGLIYVGSMSAGILVLQTQFSSVAFYLLRLLLLVLFIASTFWSGLIGKEDLKKIADRIRPQHGRRTA